MLAHLASTPGWHRAVGRGCASHRPAGTYQRVVCRRQDRRYPAMPAYRRQYECDFISAMRPLSTDPATAYEAPSSHVVAALQVTIHRARFAVELVVIWVLGSAEANFSSSKSSSIRWQLDLSMRRTSRNSALPGHARQPPRAPCRERRQMHNRISNENSCLPRSLAE